MIREHYFFITIVGIFVLFILGVTITGTKQTVTGYYVKDIMFCEPMTCSERGLEPSRSFYCDEDLCYRDCYQNGNLIEMATFCEKGLKHVTQ